MKFCTLIPQYLVCPPELLIMSSTLRLNDCARFSNMVSGKDFQVLSNLLNNSAFVLGYGALYAESLRMDHKFSIGIKSGEFPGHTPFPQTSTLRSSKTVVTILAVWGVAPSCSKVTFRDAGNKLWSFNASVYKGRISSL